MALDIEETEDQRSQRLGNTGIYLHRVLNSPRLIPTIGLVRQTLTLDDEVIT